MSNSYSAAPYLDIVRRDSHLHEQELVIKKTVPSVGEIILYNEKKLNTREKDGYMWHRPACREFARVAEINGKFVILESVYAQAKYISAIRRIDFMLGLYYYITIKQLPDNCVSLSWHEKEIASFRKSHPECLDTFERMLIETSAEYRRE